MSKILKRPMFRKGGSTNEGIMTGLVDRKGYAQGPSWEEVMAKNPNMAKAYEAFGAIDAPRDTSLSEMLIGGGLNLISGAGAGEGLMANIARSYKGPSETFFERQRTASDYDRKLKQAAVSSGLEQDFAMDQLKAKSAGSGLQKDYSTDRKYFQLLEKYSEAPKDRYSKTITNLYPHGMAEFGSRIQDNAYKSEEGVAIMQNLDGVVPHEIKGGQAQWQYEKMDAGAMYYHPQYKAFVQREPRTEDAPEQIIVYDPYTFKEVRRVNLG